MSTRVARTVVRVLAVNVAILAVGVVVLEVAFGNWLSPNRMNRLNIPREFTRLVDVSPLYASSDRWVRYTRDAHGFRGAYPSVDHIDIVTIGGSATDQRYIADGQTWQDVLARTFQEHGQRISVVNAGVDGQSTYGHIKDFEWWFPTIPNFKTRFFLFYIGLNDVHKDDGYAADRLLKASSPVKAVLEQNSALYQLYRTLDGMYQAAVVAKLRHGQIRFAEAQWTSTPHLHDHEALLRDRLTAYRGRLRTLGQKVAQAGSGLICVTQPSHTYKRVDGTIVGIEPLGFFDGKPINGVDHYRMIQLFHRVTLETCREMGGRSIDLANALDWDDADFYDYAHNTPSGADKIGRYLYTQLSDITEGRPRLQAER
jgi:hypothetical protein